MKPGGRISESRIAGVVLTGGASRRMGEDKALLSLEGRAFACIAAELLSAECAQVILVGGTSPELSGLGWPHIPDRTAGLGPLGGMITAFESAEAERVIFLPCDLPMLSGRILRGVIDRASDGGDVIVVSSGGRVHPLVGIYARTVVPVLKSFLEQRGRSVLGFLAECKARNMSVSTFEADNPGLAMTNVNTPTEYMSLQGSVPMDT